MERPVIPTRVPLPKPIHGGPTAVVSKHPLIKKSMLDGHQTVNGARGARPQQAQGPEASTPGMLKVRMDGPKSHVISRPEPPQLTPPTVIRPPQVQPVLVAPEEPQIPAFTPEHAEVCVRALGELYKKLDPTDAEAKLVEEAALAITGLFAEPLPAQPKPATKPLQMSAMRAPGSPARMIAASPRQSFSGVAPKRTPVPIRAPLPAAVIASSAPQRPWSGDMPPDLAAVVRGDDPDEDETSNGAIENVTDAEIGISSDADTDE